MQVRRLTLAIMTAGACLPTATLASGDYSPAWWLYSVGQACQILSDGIKRCLPVAAVGPAPAAFPAPGLEPLMPAQARPQSQAASPSWPVPALPLTTTRAPSTNPYLVHTPYAAKPTAQTATAQPTQPTRSADAPIPPAHVTLPTLPPTQPRSEALAQVLPAAPTQRPAPAPALAAMPLTPEPPASTQFIASNATSRPLESPQADSATRPASPGLPKVQSPGAPSPNAGSTGAVSNLAAKLEDALAHFEFDKAELTDAGRAALDAWAAGLTPGMRLSITGHADRLGPSRYNLALSRRRAESVLRHLGSKGMRANDISLHARGESEPVVTCLGGPTPETKACLAANRRVEIKPVI